MTPDERWQGEIDRLTAEHERRLTALNGQLERISTAIELNGLTAEKLSGRLAAMDKTLRVIGIILIAVALPTFGIVVQLLVN